MEHLLLTNEQPSPNYPLFRHFHNIDTLQTFRISLLLLLQLYKNRKASNPTVVIMLTMEMMNNDALPNTKSLTTSANNVFNARA